MTFTFIWQTVRDGSFVEQSIIAPSEAKAKARWRYYWRMRIADCDTFHVID